jgi:hypothetical protein
MSRVKVALVVILCLGLIGSGCTTVFGPGKKRPKPPRYYDFNDIQIPGAMSLDKDRSLVFEASGFKAGVLTVSGRVKVDSLVAFVKDTMAKDNWHLKVSYKYPRVVLMFYKPGRTCVWSIRETAFSTTAEIWVVPSR